MEGHPVSYSLTKIIELMVPAYTNFGGKVHGGTLMSMMDKAAYVCASKTRWNLLCHRQCRCSGIFASRRGGGRWCRCWRRSTMWATNPWSLA